MNSIDKHRLILGVKTCETHEWNNEYKEATEKSTQ